MEDDGVLHTPYKNIHTMTEYLAIPEWNAPPRSLDDWTAQLAAIGHPATVEPEPPEGVWLEIESLQARGLAVIEEGHLTAIDFTFQNADPAPALTILESAARALGWELHLDEGDDD